MEAEKFIYPVQSQIWHLRRNPNKAGTDIQRTEGFWGRMADFFGGYEKIMEKMDEEGIATENRKKIEEMFTPLEKEEKQVERELRRNFEHLLKKNEPNSGQIEEWDEYYRAKFGIDVFLYFEWMQTTLPSKLPENSEILKEWESASLEVKLYLDGIEDKKLLTGINAPGVFIINWINELRKECIQKLNELEKLNISKRIKHYKNEIKVAIEKDKNKRLELDPQIEMELKNMRASKMYQLLVRDEDFVRVLKHLCKTPLIQQRFHNLFGKDNGFVRSIASKIENDALINTDESSSSSYYDGIEAKMTDIMADGEKMLTTKLKAYLSLPRDPNLWKSTISKIEREKWHQFDVIKKFLLEMDDPESVKNVIKLEMIYAYYRRLIFNLLILTERHLANGNIQIEEKFIRNLKKTFLELLIGRNGHKIDKKSNCQMHVFLYEQTKETKNPYWIMSRALVLNSPLYQLSSILIQPKRECSDEDANNLLNSLERPKIVRQEIMEANVKGDTNDVKYMQAKVQMIIWVLDKFIDEDRNGGDLEKFIQNQSEKGMITLKERLFDLMGFEGFDFMESSRRNLLKFEIIIEEMRSYLLKKILIENDVEERKWAEMRLVVVYQYQLFLKEQKDVDEESKKPYREERAKIYANSMLNMAGFIGLCLFPTGHKQIDHSNLLRLMKMMNDFGKLKANTLQQLHLMSIDEIKRYENEAFDEQRKNLAEIKVQIVGEEVQKNEEFCEILKSGIGSVYRLDMFLGKNENFNEIWIRNIEFVYFHTTENEGKLLEKIHNPLYFENVEILFNHYERALQSNDNVERLQNKLAVNIFTLMRSSEFRNEEFKSLIFMKYQKLMTEIEQLFYRIEYEKLIEIKEPEKILQLAYVHKQLLKLDINLPRRLKNEKSIDLYEIFKENHQNALKRGSEKNSKQSKLNPIYGLQELHFLMLTKLFNQIDVNGKNEEYEESSQFANWLALFTALLCSERVIKERLLEFLSIDKIKEFMSKQLGLQIRTSDFIDVERKDEEKENEPEIIVRKKKKKKAKNPTNPAERPSMEKVQANLERKLQVDPEVIIETDKADKKKRKPKKKKNQIVIKETENISIQTSKIFSPLKRTDKDLDEEKLRKELEGISLNDFANNLDVKYKDFILVNSSPELLLLIDIGAAIKEIRQRLSIVNGMKEKEIYPTTLGWSNVLVVSKELWNNLNERLEEKKQSSPMDLKIVEELQEKPEEIKQWNQKELKIILFELYKTLKALIIGMKNSTEIDEMKRIQNLKIDDHWNDEKNALFHLLTQLHLNNLAKTMAKDKEFEIKWKNIPVEERESLVLFFFGIDLDELRQNWVENGENEKKRQKEKDIPMKKLKEFETKLLEGWKKQFEQRILDKKLLDEYSKNSITDHFSNHLPIESNEFLQQLTLSKEENKMEWEMTRKLLNEIGMGSGNLKSEEEGENEIDKLRESVDIAKKALDSVVRIWSNEFTKKDSDGNAKPAILLLENGAYQLGILTAHTKIEMKIIAAGHIIPLKFLPKELGSKAEFNYENFFGGEKCVKNKKQECNDTSLYCQLCQNEHIFNLKKLEKSLIPSLTFSFCPQITTDPADCFHFDLTIVSIPEIEEITPNLLKNVEFLQKKFLKPKEELLDIKWGDQRFAMLDILSTHRFHTDLLNQMNNRNVRKHFQTITMALNIWAKNRQIDSRSFGQLNESAMTILVTKIILRYPNATIPFLLEQFFLTYTTWPWPVPIQLKELSPINNEIKLNAMAWNPAREFNKKAIFFIPKLNETGRRPNKDGKHFYGLAMPVIKPGFPEDNTAYTMNQYTMELVQREMLDGLKMIRQIRNGKTEFYQNEKGDSIVNESEKDNTQELWHQFLYGTQQFYQKYDHFILITCRVPHNEEAKKYDEEELFDNYCQYYVNHRIRDSLLLHVERQSNIRLCHLSALDGPKREEMRLITKQTEMIGEASSSNRMPKQIDLEKNQGSGPVHASNGNLCVQSKFMRPMKVYASNQSFCVQSKIYASNRFF